MQVNLAIDRDYYRKQREAAQSKTPAPERLPLWIEKQVVKAEKWALQAAKEAGHPIQDILSFNVIQEICQGRL